MQLKRTVTLGNFKSCTCGPSVKYILPSVTFPKYANEMVLTVFFRSNFIQCGPEGAKLVKIPWSCVGRILTGAVGRQNKIAAWVLSQLCYPNTHFTPSVTM